MKRNVCIFLVLLMVTVFCFAACESPASEQSSSQSAAVQESATKEAPSAGETTTGKPWPRDIVIGYAGLNESQEHLIPVGDNIEKVAAEKAKELGINIKVIRVDNASDGAKAVENVDNLLLQGIDVLVEFNAAAAVNDTIWQKCVEAGVPVMAIDIPVGDAPFMGADNAGAGEKCGEALGNLVNENWGGTIDAVLFEDEPAAGEVVRIRMDSIWTGIASKTNYSVEELEAMTTRVDYADDAIKAQQLCADFLSAHPDMKHIVIGCANDIGAQGAFAAIQAANRDSDCFIVNHGVSVQTRQNIYDQINSGKLNCWRGGVSYFLEHYGEYVVPGCLELVQGITPDPESLLMDHIFIDANNIEDWYPQAEWAQN